MGLYDSVWIACPKCGEKVEFQSKGGDCLQQNFTLQDCPEDVLQNVNRHSPCACQCGAKLRIDIEKREVVVVE